MYGKSFRRQGDLTRHQKFCGGYTLPAQAMSRASLSQLFELWVVERSQGVCACMCVCAYMHAWCVCVWWGDTIDACCCSRWVGWTGCWLHSTHSTNVLTFQLPTTILFLLDFSIMFQLNVTKIKACAIYDDTSLELRAPRQVSYY